jgi:hypothetical protein
MKKDQFLRRTVPTCFLIMALAFLTFIYPGLPSINSTTLNTYNLQPSNLPSPYEFGNSEPITSITATYVTILSVMNIPASDVDALPITDQNDTFIPATDVPPTDPEADGCSSSLFSEIKACFHAPSPARCIKGVITDWLTDLTAKVRSAEWLKKWESSSEKDQAEDVPKPLPTSTTKPDLSPTGTLPTADEYLHLLRAIMLSA